MSIRSLAVLCLAVALAACGDDKPDHENIDIRKLRVVKVSGDQAAHIPRANPSQSLGVRFAMVGADGYTDEPLVARVEGEGGAQFSALGPSFSLVPAGTPIHWQLTGGCGRLFALRTETDDSAFIVNRWGPGTVVMQCRASAGRLLPDGEIIIDATWDLEILPGPIDPAASKWPWGKRQVGDTHEPYTIALAGQGPLVEDLWRDEYGNVIPYRIVGTQYVEALGDAFGSDEGRMIRLTRADVAPGDTASLRFERRGAEGPDLLIEFAVEALGGLEDGAVPVRLTVRQIASS